MRKLVLVTAVITLMVFGGTAQAWQPGWTTLDMPGANINTTKPWGIDGNKVVGYFNPQWEASNVTQGFVYDGANWTPLQASGAWKTIAYGIDGNNVVGFYQQGDWSIPGHGFLFKIDSSTWIPLDAPWATGGTVAYDIDGGNIVGTYYDVSGAHGYRYNIESLTWTKLDKPGAMRTLVFGIDGSNIVGYYEDGTDYNKGFIYNGTDWITLNPPGDPTSIDVLGIAGNNIVGWYGGGTSITTGYFYEGGNWSLLNKPGATNTYAYGIDGNSISGWYNDNTGNHGFVYTMVPEPGSLLALACGVLGLVGIRRRRA